MASAHKVGLIHRDIKPDNIFIGDDGRWVLGDFGIAFESGATRHTGHGDVPPMTKTWRPDWMAIPVGDEQVKVTVDIYMLAKVAYAMIAGPDKNPPASQLNKPQFDLRVLHPQMEQVGPIHQFVLDHVVATDSDDVKSQDIDSFIAKLDELIARFEWRASEQELFSFLSTNESNRVHENALGTLQGLAVRLPKGTKTLRCAVRLLVGARTSHAEAIKLVLRAVGNERDIAVGRIEFALEPDPKGVGRWLKLDIPISGEVANDWYSFGIDELRGGLFVTGLVVYAHASG